jgi:hypothetical protein
MEQTSADLEITTSNPELLMYYLRSAVNTPKYAHLKDKFRFRRTKNIVTCVYREIVPIDAEVKVVPNEVVKDALSQIEIVQYLIANKPTAITFMDTSLLSLKDVKKLNKFAESYSYAIQLDEVQKSITFILQQDAPDVG